jgi:hypothetical protein
MTNLLVFSACMLLGELGFRLFWSPKSGLNVPVIDVAIQALVRPDHPSLTFPIDGHLNESGHAYVAQQAAPDLGVFLKYR